MFLKARAVWKSREYGSNMYVMSLLYRVLGTIIESNTKSKLPEHFLNAVSIINSNYRNSDFSVKSVCNKAGIGETAFRKLFAEHYRKPPVVYITELRIEYARNLISGGMSVE